MKRAFVLVLLLSAGSALAQAATPACEALGQRIAQSPNAIEGRLLTESLFEAAAMDCPAIARAMLERGASVRSRNRFGATPLAAAAARGSRDVAALLLEQGADVNHTNLNGTSALLSAVQERRRRMASMLLEVGADPNIANRQGITPLMAAAFEGDRRMLSELLAAGADATAVDAYGKSVLVYAAGRAFPAVVEALLDAGARADAVLGHDLTPLMWAAGHANDAPERDGVEVARLLHAAGAALNRKDDRGRTALMVAAERGHARMVAFLLEAGADPALRDMDGKSASDLAANAAVSEALGG